MLQFLKILQLDRYKITLQILDPKLSRQEKWEKGNKQKGIKAQEVMYLKTREIVSVWTLIFFFFFVFLPFLGPLLWHMEVLRLGVKLELQPLAYIRATATRVPSRVCNLHHSSRQRWIVNPLSKGRDRTRNLMVPKSDLLTTAPRRELPLAYLF